MINAVPPWLAAEYPKFLQYGDPEDEREPPVPLSCENENDIHVECRDAWDYRILRGCYDREMERLEGGAGLGREGKRGVEVKREFYGYVDELSMHWKWSAKWLRKILGELGEGESRAVGEGKEVVSGGGERNGVTIEEANEGDEGNSEKVEDNCGASEQNGERIEGANERYGKKVERLTV